MAAAGDTAAVITAVAAIAVVIGGYIKFVLVETRVTAQIDLDFVSLSRTANAITGDLTCLVTNLGTSVLVVTQIRFRGNFSVSDDSGVTDLEPNMSHPVSVDETGHSSWTRLLKSQKQLQADRSTTAANVGTSWTKQMEADDEAGGSTRTTVFGGATQAYRKPIRLPADAQDLTIWIAADYHVHVGRLNRWLAKP